MHFNCAKSFPISNGPPPRRPLWKWSSTITNTTTTTLCRRRLTESQLIEQTRLFTDFPTPAEVKWHRASVSRQSSSHLVAADSPATVTIRSSSYHNRGHGCHQDREPRAITFLLQKHTPDSPRTIDGSMVAQKTVNINLTIVVVGWWTNVNKFFLWQILTGLPAWTVADDEDDARAPAQWNWVQHHRHGLDGWIDGNSKNPQRERKRQ